tara:strand:+ start:335 stop:502 length:168 start_codon:yes stop_codon:yes gene_type:complete
MDINTLKIYLANTATMAITFTRVDQAIKLTLLIATLVFTIVKTIDIIKGWKNNKK